MELDEPKIIVIGAGLLEDCHGMADLRRLIREGKAILITGAIIEGFALATQTAREEMQEMSRAMTSFSGDINLSKESIEALIESMKLTEFMPRDYFPPFIPIVQNYKQQNLNYSYQRDKRKFRAAINRR